MLLRAALALAALAVAAVLVVQAVGARADAELSRLVLSPSQPTAARLAGGRTLLARARRLTPDTRPDVLGGLLRLRAGDTRGALAALRGVVRREPENLEAWALIARLAQGQDAALEATARSRVRALAPPVR
jgi:hypothetical protein